MNDSTVRYTGTPEDYFIIDAETAPTKWPVDEIDCAISRASGVIGLLIIQLGSECGQTPEATLTDAAWSAIGDMEAISKLASHHNNQEVCKAARVASSGLSAISMFWSGGVSSPPASFIISDCLELVLVQLRQIKTMSYQEHER